MAKEALLLAAPNLLLATSAFLFAYFYAHARWMEGVPLPLLLYWLLHYLPTSLAQGLPVAFAASLATAASRFRDEGGLEASASAGISPLRLAAPYLLLASGGSLAILAFGEVLGPRALLEAKGLWWEEVQGQGGGLARLANRPLPLGEGRVLVYGRFDPKQKAVEHVRLYQSDAQGRTLLFIAADWGRWEEEGMLLERWKLYRLRLDRLPQSLSYAGKPPREALWMTGQGNALHIALGLRQREALARYADGDDIPLPLDKAVLDLWAGKEGALREVPFRLSLALSPLALAPVVVAATWRREGRVRSSWGFGLTAGVGYYALLLLMKAGLEGSLFFPWLALALPFGLFAFGLALLAKL